MPDDLDDLAERLRALGPHLDVGQPADPWPAVRARLTAPMSATSTDPTPGPAPAPERAGPARTGRGWIRWWGGRWWAPAGRRWVLAGIAALLALVAGVAPARAAVVDAVGGLLRIAGIEVRREPVPGGLPSRPSPLPSLSTVTLAEARRVAPFPVRVPATLGAPGQVQLGDPGPAGVPRVVTLVYAGGTVRLDAFDGSLRPYFFKTVRDARWTEVGEDEAAWLPAPHPISYVGRDGVERTETARLAGPTLVWTHGGVTYRLEGVPELEQARTVAASLR